MSRARHKANGGSAGSDKSPFTSAGGGSADKSPFSSAASSAPKAKGGEVSFKGLKSSEKRLDRKRGGGCR
jgi:hypothetical protein